MIEEWHEVDWVGIIKKNDDTQKKPTPIELLDDYDERLRGESQWKDLQ